MVGGLAGVKEAEILYGSNGRQHKSSRRRRDGKKGREVSRRERVLSNRAVNSMFMKVRKVSRRQMEDEVKIQP